RAQEVGVQRMRRSRLRHGRLRRRQRLAQYLAAEHVAGPDVAALAAEQVFFQAFAREQVDQFGNGRSHGGSGGKSPAIIRAAPRRAGSGNALQSAARQHAWPREQRPRIALARHRYRGIVAGRHPFGVEVLVAGDVAQRGQGGAQVAEQRQQRLDLGVGVGLVHRLVGHGQPVQRPRFTSSVPTERALWPRTWWATRSGGTYSTMRPSRSMYQWPLLPVPLPG